MRNGLSIMLVILSLATATGDTPLRKKVLLIGIDGTRPDALAAARTPNLDLLKANGCFSDQAITHPVTHSAACWSSMFTGVWGDKHGVNDPNNSFAGNHFDRYPSFLSRLKSADSNCQTVVFARWAPLTNATAGADTIRSFASDAAITSATCDQLANSNPDVLYTILLDVDSAGHGAGGFSPTSTSYIRAIETADARVGQIINALTNRPAYAQEDWLVMVLSDHGAHDGTIPETRLTFHLISGRSAARGTIYPAPSIVDVCVTVLAHLGVPVDPAWDLDGRVEGLPLPPPLFGTNLILNGDAESNSGTNNVTPNRGIAWWSDVADLSLGVYGTHPGFPSASSPGPPNRGRNFFLGGTTGSAVLQTIDISGLATFVDRQTVEYRLSGYFGGPSNRNDSLCLTAHFLAADNESLATNAIGNVQAAERNGTTSLIECDTHGPLPAGTRLIRFTLAAKGPGGANFACADNLSLILNLRTNEPIRLSECLVDHGQAHVEFSGPSYGLFQLERAVELGSWSTVAAVAGGEGKQVLVDTNPPPGRAFYRIRF